MRYDIPCRDRQGIVVGTESRASHPASLRPPSCTVVSRYRLSCAVLHRCRRTSPRRQRYCLNLVCANVVPEVSVLIQACFLKLAFHSGRFVSALIRRTDLRRYCVLIWLQVVASFPPGCTSNITVAPSSINSLISCSLRALL